jgi:phosphosulfolactate phosphohydrolase-like enzyme
MNDTNNPTNNKTIGNKFCENADMNNILAVISATVTILGNLNLAAQYIIPTKRRAVNISILPAISLTKSPCQSR